MTTEILCALFHNPLPRSPFYNDSMDVDAYRKGGAARVAEKAFASCPYVANGGIEKTSWQAGWLAADAICGDGDKFVRVP